MAKRRAAIFVRHSARGRQIHITAAYSAGAASSQPFVAAIALIVRRQPAVHTNAPTVQTAKMKPRNAKILSACRSHCGSG